MKKFILSLTALCLFVGISFGQTNININANMPPKVAATTHLAPIVGGGNLVVGNVSLKETTANYLQTIKYLTVAPSRQNSPAFQGNNVQAIQALEDSLRRQIFDAMNYNQSERFVFANLRKAQDNFVMRIEAIFFMVNMHKGPKHGGVDFGYFGPQVPVQADRHWRSLSPVFTFTTLPGTRPAEAIDGMVSHRFRGECLGALEITVLQAARKAMGASYFNYVHPQGLTVGPTGTSVHRHIRPAARIKLSDMVPGDWVYMKNQDDYNTDLKPGVPKGYWTGENAVYLGRYDNINDQFLPLYHKDCAQRFSGMGVYNVSDGGMRQELKKGFVSLMQTGSTYQHHPITDSNIRWTEVNRLVVGN